MLFDEILNQARASRGGLSDSPWVRVSGGGDAASGVAEALERAPGEGGTGARVVRAGSFGCGDLEPLLTVWRPGGPAVLYARVGAAEASELAADYLKNGEARPDRALCTMGEGGITGVARAGDLPLFGVQSRVALRNCGLSDPEGLDRYVAWAHGYSGLSRALRTDGAGVIDALRPFGLPGSGGCGLADTLEVLRGAGGDGKHLVCDAVDGDPPAPVSRLLLEGDPHAVLEGMLIAAYAMGACRAILCMDTASSAAAARVARALEEMGRAGLAGANILGSSFSCDVEIRQTAASLVAGEETALLRFLEGRQAMPAVRPEGDALRLFGKPSLVAAPETLSKLAALFQDKAAAKAADAAAGTRIVALSGDVVRRCIVEVPLETTVRALVEGAGGGVATGRSVKAIGIGSPIARLLGPGDMDLVIGSEPLAHACPGERPVVIEVFDTDRCAVELADEQMAFLQTQTCGKCVFCREGILQMADILHSIVAGEGNREDLDLLASLGGAMETGSICFVGKTAAATVLGGLGLSREEYDAHIKDKRCPLSKGK